VSPRTKVILWLCGLGLIDVVIPVPIVAVIAVYVVATRPAWLPRMVEEVYRGG